MYYLPSWIYLIELFKIHAFYPAWRGLYILCSYSTYMTPRIKNCLYIYIHSWSWCSLCSYRLQACSEKGRHFIGTLLFQSCCLKNVETWTCNSAPSAWYSRQYQSWDCGTKHFSTVWHEINTSAIGGSLLMRLEQSTERVPGSAKIICDCFLPPSLIIF